MIITSLMDDYCPKRGLRGEHGLSFYIETGGLKLLFDAGQSGNFLENAQFLGVDLSHLNAVVLSHGHYDHGGGLNALYESRYPLPPPLYVGRGFDAPRWAKHEDGFKAIGLAALALPPGAPAPIVIDTFNELAQRVFFLPHVERFDGTEPNPRFRTMSKEDNRIDTFDDELSLVIEADDGISVVTGCAHRGLANIARSALQLFPGKALKALIGGFHFVDIPEATLSKAAAMVAELAPEKVFCSHCTGLPGFAALLAAMPGKVSWLSCGTRVEL